MTIDKSVRHEQGFWYVYDDQGNREAYETELEARQRATELQLRGGSVDD
jgi:hypothetical protein